MQLPLNVNGSPLDFTYELTVVAWLGQTIPQEVDASVAQALEHEHVEGAVHHVEARDDVQIVTQLLLAAKVKTRSRVEIMSRTEIMSWEEIKINVLHKDHKHAVHNSYIQKY